MAESYRKRSGMADKYAFGHPFPDRLFEIETWPTFKRVFGHPEMSRSDDLSSVGNVMARF